MIKILLGGSPCTHWSIAQKNGRETQPNSGLGWELFLNYKIALEKYKPDYFLYENNESASQDIKDEIARQLNVVKPDLLTPDTGVRMTHINSALVSAQQRKRFYVTNFGDIYQPQDRGILLRDVLDGMTYRSTARTILRGGEPVYIGEMPEHKGTYRNGKQPSQQYRVYDINAKGVAVTTCAITNVAIPVRVGTMPKSDGAAVDHQQSRIYSIDGKATNLNANGGGQGAKTGLYALPVDNYYAVPVERDKHGRPTKAISGDDCKVYTVYEVNGGIITIRGKQYPIKLPDGFYIIRKLTVNECKRLQTIPDWYEFPAKDAQAYKMLGNGWTIEVIKYLLSHIPNIQNEDIEVLSMYDGMSCGQIALKEMGCNVVKYYATEIDKYAIQTTQHNFPNTIQLGDAFQVREEGWHI